MKSSIARVYYTIVTFIALLSTYSYLYLDIDILNYFYSHIGRPINHYIQLLSHLGKSTIYIVGSVMIYLIYRISYPKVAKDALFILSTTIISGILVNIIKVIAGRARPRLYIDEHLYGFFWLKMDVLYRSFPSGHATTAMGVWLGFALLFPRYRLALILMGIAISFSRVVLTEHYLSDVLLGGFLGSAVTIVLYYIFYPKGTINNEE